MSAAAKSTSPERIASIHAIRDRFKGDNAANEGHDISTLRRETLAQAGISHWVGVYGLKRGGAAAG